MYRVICNYTTPAHAAHDLSTTHEHLVRRTFVTIDQARKYASSVAASRNPQILEVLPGPSQTDATIQVRADGMREQLDHMLLPWEEDGSVPPNYVRKTGTGKLICEVTRPFGGFQDPHGPVMIGWRTSGYEGGVLLVADYPGIDEAIAYAKNLCAATLRRNCPDKYEED